MTAQIRRGSARFVERRPGRQTKHAFSFGEHYDTQHLSFGPMVCHDEHVLGPGQGFEKHRHEALDIVTVVLTGELQHSHDGSTATVPSGSVAVLRSGSGVSHSEHAGNGPCHFLQTWLRAPEGSPDAPSYEVAPIEPSTGEPLLVAEPHPGARLWSLQLGVRETGRLPQARLVHAYVVTGALTRHSVVEPMSAGDAFLLTDEPAHEITSGAETSLLIWTFDSAASAEPSARRAVGLSRVGGREA